MALTVNLMGPSPWGFRIYGGRDFKKAITVSKVNGGSKAELAALRPGDIILEINGQNTADMLNVEAQNKIKNSTTQLQLPDLPTPGQTNGITSPEQLTGRFQDLLVCRDENQNYKEYTISSPVSLSPRPYSPEPPASPNGKTTPTSTKSIHLRPWSPEERSQVFSRPLSQKHSTASPTKTSFHRTVGGRRGAVEVRHASRGGGGGCDVVGTRVAPDWLAGYLEGPPAWQGRYAAMFTRPFEVHPV
ncbi:hypothetical protein NHX12_029477 [Muraenolepis orangiensis]|uniref:PDZ domain-containing protein n=1 Tax=Muraenolepis orangiensis TaxID=630683 RepID=A0A9Q0INM1_9TELE|nr:hypothetical protein NHX12_029477 [Muraenolepis orangiensis]